MLSQSVFQVAWKHRPNLTFSQLLEIAFLESIHCHDSGDKASVNSENELAKTTKYGKTIPHPSFNLECNFILYNEENMAEKKFQKKIKAL